MMYALDANIISYLLRGNDSIIEKWRYERTIGNQSTIPIVAYYEVKRGLIASKATTKLKALEELCEAIGIIEFTIQDADTSSSIYGKLKVNGNLIDDADILIAAQAINRGHTLVTNNAKHFDRVDDLDIVNWTE